MKTIFDPVKDPPQHDSLSSIEAYSIAESYAQGENPQFCVRIPVESNFTAVITRYETGDTYVTTLNGTAGPQPTNINPDVNGCGWQPNLTFDVSQLLPLPSGAYKAHFDAGNQGTFDVIFFIRSANPGVNAKILLVAPVNTFQAYNAWNGYSLYYGPNGYGDRARKVSFNRPNPYSVWSVEQGNGNWIKPFIVWLANNGYLDPANPMVEFATSLDLQNYPTILYNYRLVLSIGHDEYWSWEMRDRLQNFIEAGGNVAFFSSNVSWWQVRLETSPDTGEANRELVCYKEILQPEGYYLPGEDPYLLNPPPRNQHTTCNWFDILTQRPENLMTGVSYYWGTALWSTFQTTFRASLQRHWLMKNTGLSDRDNFGGSLFTCFETDAADFVDLDRKFPIPTGKIAYETTQFSAPKDLMILASANLTELGEIQGTWDGPSNHNGWATIGIFRKPRGGFVFHGGIYNWAKGLGLQPIDAITRNVIEIFRVAFTAQAFLLLNASFESGDLSGWNTTPSGYASIVSPGYGDNYCVLIEAPIGETFLSQAYIPIRTNRPYRISCFAKSSPPNGSPGVTISLQVIDEFGTPGDDIITASYSGTGDWQQISAEGVLSNNDTIMVQARVKLVVQMGGSAYFDNVVVEELP